MTIHTLQKKRAGEENHYPHHRCTTLRMDFETMAHHFHGDFNLTFPKSGEPLMSFTDFVEKWREYIKQHFDIITDRELHIQDVCYGVAYVINARIQKRYGLKDD